MVAYTGEECRGEFTMLLIVVSRFGVLLCFRPQIQPTMKKIAINTTADDDAMVIMIAIKLSRARPAGKKAL